MCSSCARGDPRARRRIGVRRGEYDRSHSASNVRVGGRWDAQAPVPYVIAPARVKLGSEYTINIRWMAWSPAVSGSVQVVVAPIDGSMPTRFLSAGVTLNGHPIHVRLRSHWYFNAALPAPHERDGVSDLDIKLEVKALRVVKAPNPSWSGISTTWRSTRPQYASASISIGTTYFTHRVVPTASTGELR